MKKLLLLAAGCAATATLYAQQKTHPLNEVIVTANKFDQKASETGKVIEVITADDLARQKGRSLSQVLNNQPGLTINGAQGSPGTDQTYYLRGADPKYTLIMINGIPLSDISQINSYFDLNLIPVAAIARIEILKGGYATLYGSGAAAGVINIITKKGGADAFGLHVQLEAGSYGTFRQELGVRGQVGKSDYNIALQNTDTKGFSSATDTLGSQHFDQDGYHRRSVLANWGFHPGAHWTLRPFIRFSHQKGDMDAAAFIDDKDNEYTTDYFQTGIAITHRFQKGDLHIKYSFNPIGRHYSNDTTSGDTFQRDTYKSQVHTADVYLHYRISQRLSFLAGNAFRIERTDQRVDDVYYGSPSKSHLSPDSAQADIMSLYGAVFYHNPSGLHIELGGRLHQHKAYGFHPVFSINPSWLIHDKVKLFVNVASFYNSPSLYQLYSAYGNRKLQPESGNSYEAGVETWLAGKRIRLAANGFYRDTRDMMAFANLHYVNYDRQQAKGGEATATYRISGTWQLSAWYSYATGEVTVKNDITGKDSTYNNLFKRPKSSAGLGVNWQPVPALQLSLSGKYVGKRSDLFSDPVDYHQELRRLDAYCLVDFYAQYTFKKRYQIFAGLNNLLDSQYIETTGFNTMGFNWTAGLSLDLF